MQYNNRVSGRIIIIITYFISCWQNAAKQYVVIVKLVEIKKKKNVQIMILKKQIDASIKQWT